MFLWCGKVSPWTDDTRQQVKHFKSSMITVIANLTHIISRLLPESGFVLVQHQCRMYDNCKSRPEKILDVRNIERNTGRKIHISPEKIKSSDRWYGKSIRFWRWKGKQIAGKNWHPQTASFLRICFLVFVEFYNSKICCSFFLEISYFQLK